MDRSCVGKGGISSSFLSLIEQAQSDITIGRLARLAEFYDVELADLLSGLRARPPTMYGSSAPRRRFADGTRASARFAACATARSL